MKSYQSIKELQNNPEVKKILKDSEEVKTNHRKRATRLIILIISIVVISFTAFKIFVKEIYLDSHLPYEYGYGYVVKIDDTLVSTTVLEKYENTIIPFVLKVNSYSENIFGDGTYYMPLKANQKYKLDISVHECYATNMKDILVKCNKPYVNYELKDIEINNWFLKIRADKETIYNEKYKELRFAEKGNYYCTLYTKIKNRTLEVTFGVTVD